jgi:hypothetical protein
MIRAGSMEISTQPPAAAPSVWRRRLTLAMLAPWIAFFLPLYVYLFGLRFQGRGDATPAELLPIVLHHGHGFDFREFVPPGGPLPYWFRLVGGRVISSYPVLPGLLNVPVYAVAGLVGVDVEAHRQLLSGLTSSMLSALSVLFLYLALERVCRSREMALGFSLVYAFGTTVWSVASRGCSRAFGALPLGCSMGLSPWSRAVPGRGALGPRSSHARPTSRSISARPLCRRHTNGRFFVSPPSPRSRVSSTRGTPRLPGISLRSPQAVSGQFPGSARRGWQDCSSARRADSSFSPFFLFAIPAIVGSARPAAAADRDRLPRYLLAGIGLDLLLFASGGCGGGGSTFGYRC